MTRTSKPEMGFHIGLTGPIITPKHPCFMLDNEKGLRIVGQWSGTAKRGCHEPPQTGTRVKVTFNGLGCGSVVGYFVESGFIGVEVKPDKQPDWHVKQNGGRQNYLVFGAEIEREIIQSEPAKP